jgi:hypothetical protein
VALESRNNIPVKPHPFDLPEDLEETPFGRFVPLIAWLIVVVTLIAIPFQILSTGFLPGGDARRHVAKAFTDKPYTEILLLRPDYSMDHSPGWEKLLRHLHVTGDLNRDALVTVSVAGLMLCVFFAPLPWLRRPEAWLTALLAQMIAIPEIMTRLTQARPLLLTEGVLIAILYSWTKTGSEKPSKLKLTLTCLGVALSVWMHGAWYLWALPVLAFLLARAWRTVWWLLLCVVIGIFAGALFTGKPIEFLRQALLILADISREHLPQWMLVGELRPSYGEFDTIILLILVAIWRRFRDRDQTSFLNQPAFCLIVVCWILGFKADRFWADWGVPASLVWLTFQFEDILATLWQAGSPRRLVICVLIAIPLFLHTTNDLDRRYTFNQNETFLDASDKKLEGWLPEKNGIFYSAQMEFFYNTFYTNPTADWRYILGLEPALMPDDDLRIFRTIQYNKFAPPAYEPWIKKMQPGDRLAIYSPVEPNLPELQWHLALGNLWIGRLPR